MKKEVLQLLKAYIDDLDTRIENCNYTSGVLILLCKLNAAIEIKDIILKYINDIEN